MEQSPYQQQEILSPQQPLPNASTVLVLGILSIVVCFICGIIALVLAEKDRRLYRAAPSMYSSSSYDLLKAGRICSIISLCLAGAIIVFIIFVLLFAYSVHFFND